MSKILHPIEYYEFQDNDLPIFLGGPIRGTEFWREKIIALIQANYQGTKNLIFIDPTRIGGQKILTPWHEDFVSRQRQWEQYYLRLALKKWRIVFYLAEQTILLPRDIEGFQEKAYGAITHIEIGQIMVQANIRSRLIVGIHDRYPEKSTIVNDLQSSHYLDLSSPYSPKVLSDFPVYSTLEEVAKGVSWTL